MYGGDFQKFITLIAVAGDIKNLFHRNKFISFEVLRKTRSILNVVVAWIWLYNDRGNENNRHVGKCVERLHEFIMRLFFLIKNWFHARTCNYLRPVSNGTYSYHFIVD